MRLIDLFEAPIPTVKKALARKDMSARMSGPHNSNYVGGGAWGNVYSVPGDVETVSKVSKVVDQKWKHDGYYNFINKIRDYKNETHNPFLPQIYDVTKYHSASSKHNKAEPYLVVNLEKLYPAYDLSQPELELVLQRSFRTTNPNADFERIFNFERRFHAGDIPAIIQQALRGTIENFGSPFRASDPALIQALNIIKKLHKKGFALDLQIANFMFRRTPYGPQLVLTDPVSYYDPQIKLRMSPNKQPEKALEAAEPISTDAKAFSTADQELSYQGKQLGSGYFAKAYEKPSDVTTVSKIAHLNNHKWDQDGYYAYIEKIKKLSNFVYLPQIHSIKRVEPSTGSQPYLIVEVEKLIPTTKINRDELAFVFSKIIGENINKHFPTIQYDRNDLAQALGCLMERTVTGQYPWIPESIRRGLENVKIVDPELIKVLKILRNLYQQGFSPDVHSGNFMFRRTPYGPQMVLTDPLAFKMSDPVKVRMAKGEKVWEAKAPALAPDEEGTFDPNPDSAKVDTTKKVSDFKTTKTPHSIDIAHSRVMDKGKGKELGSGAFAVAYSVPKDVETVVKVAALEVGWEYDGYYNYVKNIFKKQDNPYLPQIYEVLKMQPKNNEPYLMVNIEKLIDSGALSKEELLFVCKKIFNKTDIGRYIKRQMYSLSTDSIRQYIGRGLEAYVTKNDHSNNIFPIVDPQLTEALNIVKYLFEKKFSLDIHYGNFMFRRTPYGPQLVLTDPLCGIIQSDSWQTDNWT